MKRCVCLAITLRFTFWLARLLEYFLLNSSETKKKTKTMVPGGMHDSFGVDSTEILLFVGIVLLVSAISEGKGLALLKF